MVRMIECWMEMELMVVMVVFINAMVDVDIWQWILYAHIWKISVDSLDIC